MVLVDILIPLEMIKQYIGQQKATIPTRGAVMGENARAFGDREIQPLPVSLG
ncbi:MAG: hypothetical protein M0037_09800 [Betaproteobacteria bacterium]|nr:hypothetical protein [Betaproteobacteria bacterium]